MIIIYNILYISSNLLCLTYTEVIKVHVTVYKVKINLLLKQSITSLILTNAKNDRL